MISTLQKNVLSIWSIHSHTTTHRFNSIANYLLEFVIFSLSPFSLPSLPPTSLFPYLPPTSLFPPSRPPLFFLYLEINLDKSWSIEISSTFSQHFHNGNWKA